MTIAKIVLPALDGILTRRAKLKYWIPVFTGLTKMRVLTFMRNCKNDFPESRTLDSELELSATN
jgi:hypothetical protein